MNILKSDHCCKEDSLRILLLYVIHICLYLISFHDFISDYILVWLTRSFSPGGGSHQLYCPKFPSFDKNDLEERNDHKQKSYYKIPKPFR